jgi:hypothetical protein
LVLTTTDPAVLIGNLSRFPPQGEVYQLQNRSNWFYRRTQKLRSPAVDKFTVQIGGS